MKPIATKPTEAQIMWLEGFRAAFLLIQDRYDDYAMERKKMLKNLDNK